MADNDNNNMNGAPPAEDVPDNNEGGGGNDINGHQIDDAPLAIQYLQALVNIQLAIGVIADYVLDIEGLLDQLRRYTSASSGLFSGVFLPHSAMLQHVQDMHPDIRDPLQVITDAILAVDNLEVRRVLLVQANLRILNRVFNP